MALPEGFIEELKIRNRIEDVISTHVTLKRAGSNMVGLCPFHSEKSPSFTVFPATRGFYCFGCGAGGDVITFVMKAENLDYMDAVAYLAKRAGIEMPEDDFQKKQDSGVKKSRILAMNRDAARFYHSMLSKPEGEAGLSYLRSRGLSDAVIRRFGLGFAPDEFTLRSPLFLNHMHGLGYTDKELVGGFLCSASQKNGRLYPIFRNRVMFPVIDTQGEVIAFGGRVMDDSKPKYLNSSDTPAFKKSRSLFALNFARSHCAERMILCEGYMDVIAIHAAGIPTAVATLGTAMTQDQAHIMARYTKEVVIAYDMDSAGRTAAEKAIRLLDAVGVQTKILVLDGAKDPDEYIRKKGADAFRLRLEGSENQFDYRCNAVIAQHNLEDFNDRLACIAEITALLGTLHSDVEREVYIGRLSEKLGVSRESLKNDIQRSKKKKEILQKKEESKRMYEVTAGIGDRINPDKMKYRSAAAAEETILGILLLYPERIAVSVAQNHLTEEDFVTAFNQRVFAYLQQCIKEHSRFDMGYLGEAFSEAEIGCITKMMVERASLTENGDTVLSDAVQRLRAEAGRVKRNAENATIEDIDEIMRRKRASLT